MRIEQLSTSGPPLVLLHGWLMDSSVWTAVLPYLQQLFAVTVVDLFATTVLFTDNAIDVPFSLTAEASFGDILAPHLPADTRLAAHSLGAALAASSMDCPRFRAKISAMAFVCMSLRFAKARDWQHGMSTELFDSFTHRLTDQRNDINRKRMFTKLLAASEPKERLLSSHLCCSRANSTENYWSTCEFLAGRQLLCKYDCRLSPFLPSFLLFITGENDPLSSPASMQESSRLIHSSKLSVIRNCGHLPMCSQPQQLSVELSALV